MTRQPAMPAPSEKLADALKALHALQGRDRRVFRSNELRRVHRERLLRSGFIREVMKGWLISSPPGARDGDSTLWYASFWEFCARYCYDRFGEDWHLSPEQSLLLHAENTVVPAQLVIYTPRGKNNVLRLPFGISLYDFKEAGMPFAADLTVREGLRLYSLAASLAKVSAAFFARFPIESQVALATIGDASEVLRPLLDGGHSVVAGRLAGAFRIVGRAEIADDIVSAFKAANYSIRETDPFAEQPTFATSGRSTPAIVERLHAMWQLMRDPVAAVFPGPPGLPKDPHEYLKHVDELYESDAYHSLSIEGFRVTHELIERVQGGRWDPDRHDDDRRSRDALAARGYWQAFQLVKTSIDEIIGGAKPGRLLRTAHRDWYRELFQPCVAVGLLPSGALAGYRNQAVYIQTSRYVPPRWEAVREAMLALFDLLAHEPDPGVRAVLGHWLFGYIHPYPDGNGRMARFVMNAMLASGGYPWTVVRVEDRDKYLAALDRASIDMNIRPFAAFLADRVSRSMHKARLIDGGGRAHTRANPRRLRVRRLSRE